ncbi:hypothetical protein O181_127314 [Austropuccinia psidii MF-1]|uniref:Uncharacterized protein n=1 Tax=Austropuccinia psidii MF-1 TaxID=1389203 RepID=A0A9Q3Q729_9BASI|nr:hypothetical protein [Austropuccinia psidii MF-1]
MPVQAPNNSHANPYACAGSRQLTRQSLRLCRLPTAHTPILTLVKVPDNSHANPYACAGSQQFTRQSLCLCRLPTTHTPILTPVKVPDHLNNSIHD